MLIGSGIMADKCRQALRLLNEIGANKNKQKVVLKSSVTFDLPGISDNILQGERESED